MIPILNHPESVEGTNMRKTLLLHCEDFYKINQDIKISQMCIYDYMQGMFNSVNKKIVRKMIGNRQYTWIAHQKIIDDMPYLGISNKTSLSRNIKKLAEYGILITHTDKKDNSRTYYCNGPNSEYINNSVASDSKVSTNLLKSNQPTDSKVSGGMTQKSHNISITYNSIKDTSGLVIDLPGSLSNKTFVDKMDNWIQYEKLSKKDIFNQLEQLKKCPDDAIDMIDQSMNRGWHRLYPVKSPNRKKAPTGPSKEEIVKQVVDEHISGNHQPLFEKYFTNTEAYKKMMSEMEYGDTRPYHKIINDMYQEIIESPELSAVTEESVL